MTELILPFVLDIQQALHGALQAILNSFTLQRTSQSNGPSAQEVLNPRIEDNEALGETSSIASIPRRKIVQLDSAV